MDSAQNSTEDAPNDHTIQENVMEKRSFAPEEDKPDVLEETPVSIPPRPHDLQSTTAHDLESTAHDLQSTTPHDLESTPPSALPGYLPWEEDMEMVSKYLDRKARMLYNVFTHVFGGGPLCLYSDVCLRNILCQKYLLWGEL